MHNQIKQPRHENIATPPQNQQYDSPRNKQRSKSRSRQKRPKQQQQYKQHKQSPVVKQEHAKVQEQNGANESVGSDIDMFADQSQVAVKQSKEGVKMQVVLTDQAGYYVPIVGSIIGQKYKIVEKLGKGVFGIVMKVVDVQDSSKVFAAKILRKNEATQASGLRQYSLLTQMHQRRKLKRIMKVYDQFMVNGHFAIICELLGIDLRTFSHRKQPTLSDIRIYAIGMILIWHQLRLSKVIHADIKPDNFLFKQQPDISNIQTSQALAERAIIDNLKLADFGTSFWVQQYKPQAQYQVARYYRAPQIILGTKIKNSEIYAIDVWAMACSLFQLFTNQFLFNGDSNNHMLKLMMETKGKFSIKMLFKSEFRDKHFDADFNFLYHTIDKISKQPKVQKMEVTITAERDLMNMLKKQGSNQNPKDLQNFRDFLQKCLTLNPKDRMTPQQAIEHPFLHFQIKLDQ